ncbi:hypothetical protein [Halobacteriovorax sp.]|uniref:hypothetical protein n=1 Tax=Halobacteriovorax sp. TaxID=2020862 RepID=UPI0035660DCC
MKLILFAFFLSHNIFAVSETCRVATINHEGALEVYVENEAVVILGMRAYQACKENLVVEEQLLVEESKEKCFEDETKTNASKVDCAFRAVEYFLYSK